MREGLAGLTARGRAFVAAGTTAVVCAVLLGQDALTRVGVLLVALPLITAYLVGRSRYRLALVRTITPQLVTAGQPAQVQLEITNEGRTPTGVLLLEDHVPYVLGTRPRFVRRGHQPRLAPRGELPGALRPARPLRDRPDDGPGRRPLRAGRARPRLPDHGSADGHAAHRRAADDPAHRRVDRLR